MEPQDTQDTTGPAPKTPARRRLTLTKETLRRLTPADLRLAAGGRANISELGCFHPKSNAWTARGRVCGGDGTDNPWTWNCPSRYPNC